MDQDKSKQQLVEEVAALRQRVAALEGVLGVNGDIAERKRVEESLRESEARYRALAESTRDIIFILDRQGTLLYANQAAAQCIGIPAGDIVGKRQMDLFPPEMARSQIEKTGRVFATGEVIEYDDLLHFGPAEVWLRIYLIPLRDDAGQITSVMGVCHNITERKRTEEALQKAHHELEQRVKERTAELAKATENLDIFRKFAEASGQGFSMADLDGRLIYLNPALCRMLDEQRPEDCIGQQLSIYYSVESNRRGKQEIVPVLMREGHWEGELPMLSRRGRSIPTWQNSFVIRDEGGNPLRLAVVITDITERKRAEEALQRERRTLKHMLQANEHERQLIAYDIHDGLAQELVAAMMQFQIFTHARKTQPKDAAKAFDAGMTMLERSHVEARRLISGVRSPVLDESGVVAAIAHLVYDPAFDQGPKIDFRNRVTFNRLVPVLENTIYRIVQEALSNARHHSQSKKILVRLVQRGDRLRIEIRDWGVGFDPKLVRENRFGLKGIRERARLLGGKCRIKSAPGEGTSIVVELPVAQREPEQ